uniref:hypothetical protein n=1 Tax=Sphingomonas sp. TaxID=28214 RepID=UPI0025EB476D|nr:hypothetical protein [Sphingomonas sp.]
MWIAIGLAVGASCWTTGAIAQTAPTPGAAPPVSPEPSDTIRLTDEQRMRILDSNTEVSAAAARGEMTGSDREALRIHGEVGVSVGSNGSHSIYGVAAIPLGEHAQATVMFESSRFNYRRKN